MPRAKLTVSGDRAEPRVFDITGDIVVGRSVRADIQIEGDLVSRQHGRFAYRDGGWHFEDLGSRNGSLLNGQRVTTGALQSGDVVMIGYGKIVFEEPDARPSTHFSVSLVESEADLASATVADDPDDASGATVALSYRDLVLINQRMNTIARISQRLATILDREELLDEVLDTLFSLFEQCDRAAIVLRNDVGAFQVVSTRQRDEGSATVSVMRISTSLIQFVQREGKAVLSADTTQDDRFSGRESIVGSGVGRSIMCAPLKVTDDFLGVIYLDTQTLMSPFRHTDVNLLQGIAGPMAICLKNAELVEEIEVETTMRTSLSRYLSPDVVREIGEGNLKPNLGGETVEGTIMFSDIVGFTAMSEKLSAADVVDRLNRYFTSMLEAIFGWEGTVDKFGGDAVLAVWGAPVANEEHRTMATAAALEMQVRLFELNCALYEAGETRIRMAVGLNSGRFVAGNIGGQDRIEWTVIGDTVNLAQRVESQGFPRCVLVSESTFEGLAGAAGAYAFPPVRVKNRAEPVRIFSVRTLRAGRDVSAAIPVIIHHDDGTARGLIFGVPAGDPAEISLNASADVPVGATVKLTGELPEGPEAPVLTGRVKSSAPLLLAKAGRTLEVVVDDADAEFTRLFEAGGAAEARRALSEIER